MPAEILKKRIFEEKYFHPKFPAGEGDAILEIFDLKDSKILSTVKVKEFWNTKPDKQASVIAYFKDEPFLVHKNFGKGTVILWTTSLNADWTNFPLTPDYLPLLQNLMIHLSSSVKPPVNILPGDPLLYSSAKPITGGVETIEQIPESLKLNVITPDGKKHPVKADQLNDEKVLEWEDTWERGLYTVMATNTLPRYFSVITDGKESDLKAFDSGTAERTKAEAFVQFIDGDNALIEAISQETGIVEWWKFFIFIAMALLCLELFFSWRFNG